MLRRSLKKKRRLDICFAIMEVLHFETSDDKYRPHPMLRKMVRGGLLGKKQVAAFLFIRIDKTTNKVHPFLCKVQMTKLAFNLRGN